MVRRRNVKLVLPLTNCATLSQFVNFSNIRFPHLYMEIIKHFPCGVTVRVKSGFRSEVLPKCLEHIPNFVKMAVPFCHQIWKTLFLAQGASK